MRKWFKKQPKVQLPRKLSSLALLGLFQGLEDPRTPAEKLEKLERDYILLTQQQDSNPWFQSWAKAKAVELGNVITNHYMTQPTVGPVKQK